MVSQQTSTTPKMTSGRKGLQVLEALALFDSSVGVSELARSMSWSRGTVHKWLITLVDAGWVQQETSGNYRLSLRVMKIVNGALNQAGIESRILPLLRDLAVSCRETVTLAVLDGSDALIVQRVESPNILSVNLKLGSRMPLDKSASGAVLVAESSPTVVQALQKSGAKLPSSKRINKVRQDGMILVSDELENNMVAAAVPVCSEGLGLISALSVAAPSQTGIPESTIQLLRETQQSITDLLTGNTASAEKSSALSEMS